MTDRCATDRNLLAHERGLIEAARREADELGQVPRPNLPPADSVPGFTILEEVGRGGMGVVYRALQLSTRRVVALKVMLAGPFAAPAARRRFRREVELAARFHHPGIVQVLESGEATTGQLYYALDHVDGFQLDEWVSATLPDVRETLGLFVELCEAVDYAHRQGVVHRDLKPANVLVDAEGKPHVLDFGLSKALEGADAQETLTICPGGSGPVLGTLSYLSPEQAAGEPGKIDERTDVYALGVMLFQAITGTLPFAAHGSHADILQRIREEAPIPLCALSARADRELEAIILKALEKEQGRRYQSVAELGEDLRRYLNHEPVLARTPSSFYVVQKKLRKQRMKIAVALSAACLLVAGVWGGIQWRGYGLQRQRARDLAAGRRQVLQLEHSLVRGVDGPLELVLSAFAQYPELPEVRLLRATAQFRAGYANATSGLVEPQLGDDPAQWAYCLLRAELYRASGRDDLADHLESQGLAGQPDTAEGWYLRSFATVDRAEAIRWARSAAHLEPDNTLFQERLFYLYLAENELEAALGRAERLTDLSPGYIEGRLQRGHILTALGRFEEAIAQYSHLLSEGLDQDYEYSAYRHRAYAYRAAREYELALVDLEEARQIAFRTGRGGAGWVLFQRVTPLWILGRTEEAAETCAQAHEALLIPTYGDARRFLILLELGREEEARRALANIRRVVADPFLGQVYAFLYGEISADQLLAAADTPVHQCEAYYYVGEVALRQGRADEAARWFGKCLDTGMLFDPGTWPPESMNEYELARWRLEALASEAADQ